MPEIKSVIDSVPLYVSVVFILATLLAVYLFFRAANNSKAVLAVIFGWMILQAAVSLTGFYTFTSSFPPRFMLLPFPPVVMILFLLFTKKGKTFLDSLDPAKLTLVHIVRVPVEIVLFLLCTYKTIPQLMTFEGRNFDILSGLTAPFIYYFGFVKNRLSKKMLLAWNFICLGLLLNIVANAALSAPFPIQQFGFDQPNIAVLYFPYVWLPCCIVPIVLLSHLASIRQLLRK